LTSSKVVGFKEESGVSFAGSHIIADFWGAKYTRDEKYIEKVLIKAAERAGAKVLFTHFHKFGGEEGITGVLVLSESHISIHTWPEEKFIALDIFMCGDAEPKIALKVLEEAFKPERVIVGNHKRGVV